MRKKFANILKNEMYKNEKLYLLTADLGFGILNDIRQEFPNRAFNVGAAEQLMIGAAIGLASMGMTPVCYSITPFLLYRPFELLRTYVNYENLNVKLVGSGRDFDYSHDGISHWAEDDEKIMSTLSNITIWKPENSESLSIGFDSWINKISPAYLNLSRAG